MMPPIDASIRRDRGTGLRSKPTPFAVPDIHAFLDTVPGETLGLIGVRVDTVPGETLGLIGVRVDTVLCVRGNVPPPSATWYLIPLVRLRSTSHRSGCGEERSRPPESPRRTPG
jgi:hypothetical protein